MRYVVGFVLALALLASPLSVGAEPTQKGSPELPSWLQIELHTPGLGMTYSESQQLALIPQHLQQRVPGHRTGQGDEDKAKIEYTPAQSPPHAEEGQSKGMSRGKKIAVGVLVPLAAVGLGAGIAAATFSLGW